MLGVVPRLHDSLHNSQPGAGAAQQRRCHDEAAAAGALVETGFTRFTPLLKAQ